MRSRLRHVIWVLFFVFLTLGYVLSTFFQPVRPGNESRTEVFIARGSTVRRVAARLEREGFIRHARAFTLLARFTGKTDIKSGHHSLGAGMSAFEILNELERMPSVKAVRVTIPEGFTLRQVAERAGTIPGVNSAEVERLAQTRGSTFKASFALPDNLEGYLFPETYEFGPDTTPQDFIQQLVTTFDEKVAVPLADEFRTSAAQGWEMGEVITLASLIEREARVASEQARISGVLHNRLKKDMPLQVDATVQYVIGHRERLLFKDLEVDSPYNTYKVKGLPPGAICNPGLPAIRAALNPEQVPYLYYVARPDGSHSFSTNFNDHTRAAQEIREHNRGANGG